MIEKVSTTGLGRAGSSSGSATLPKPAGFVKPVGFVAAPLGDRGTVALGIAAVGVLGVEGGVA